MPVLVYQRERICNGDPHVAETGNQAKFPKCPHVLDSTKNGVDILAEPLHVEGYNYRSLDHR